MKTSDFDFLLPPELIAQTPLERRDASRLLLLGRNSGSVAHTEFSALPSFLREGDLLVLNDSRVLPARLIGSKLPTGAAIELLLLERRDDCWEVLARPGRKAIPGTRFSFGDGVLEAEVIAVQEDGNRLVRFSHEGDFYAALDRVGQMPLPHYITERLEDGERYQTVYSREKGSAAAPTAGLHFTDELLGQIKNMGVGLEFVTLHVGLGTFRPVKATEIGAHKMHREHYSIPARTVEAIARTKQAGGRVIAVGTTSCRTLEACFREHGQVRACSSSTDIFLYPGERFGVIDGLITNFHLPQSTLIMLVSAFAGYDSTMNAYRAAVEERYRFFSFGDAMLIL